MSFWKSELFGQLMLGSFDFLAAVLWVYQSFILSVLASVKSVAAAESGFDARRVCGQKTKSMS